MFCLRVVTYMIDAAKVADFCQYSKKQAAFLHIDKIAIKSGRKTRIRVAVFTYLCSRFNKYVFTTNKVDKKISLCF